MHPLTVILGFLVLWSGLVFLGLSIGGLLGGTLVGIGVSLGSIWLVVAVIIIQARR